jgi:primosomal protein N' (replication factor Y) (superfamily II helicase)
MKSPQVAAEQQTSKQSTLRFGTFALGQAYGQVLTYSWDSNEMSPNPGEFYFLPLRSQKVVGLFLSEVEKPSYSCKKTLDRLTEIPQMPAKLFALMHWISDYYLSTVGDSASAMFPGFVWGLAQKPLKIKVTKLRGAQSSKLKRSGELETFSSPSILNVEQQSAVQTCLLAKPFVTLIQGVTGSGKTEVYLNLAAEILNQGRNVLILVPEISLTPQMEGRFRNVFAEELAVLHSGLAAGQWQLDWLRVADGRARVVLGVRSAVFCPLQNLGLIIVDEEHDTSYKCAEMPCYNARDVAVKRAHLENAICVLGSATPSLESIENCRLQKYGLVKITQRHSLTQVQWKWVDLRQETVESKVTKRSQPQVLRFRKSTLESLSPTVLQALEETRASGLQSMIILNRRGFASFTSCNACGENLKCPNCTVSTTLHKRGAQEICHYCGFSSVKRVQCPSCGLGEFTDFGIGTQSLESELAAKLPLLRLERLDRDVLTSESRLVSILKRFKDGDADCLIGTQMLSKGHDFPKVSLVVLLHLEETLHLPDFRSRERTFQLISQSAGRAGRATTPGMVLLQSLCAEVPLAEQALKGEIDVFLQEELELRQAATLPPFKRQMLIELQGPDEAKVFQLASLWRTVVLTHWSALGLDPKFVKLVGPVPAILEKLKGQFRFHITVSFPKNMLPKQVLPLSLWEKKQQGVKIDVDPVSFQ